MRVLIIGANGQLGTDCLDVLSVKHETVGCDIPEINISETKSVDNFLEQQKPDAIINCAAYTAVDACETDKETCWKVNAQGPWNIAKTAERLGCRLIHVSTDYVFDGKLAVPKAYVESDSTNPLSEYGKSKLAGEKNVAENCSNYLILRTAWLYSAWGKNFLKTMLRLALSSPDKELRVVNDQFGSLTWSYTLAQQIDRSLEAELTGVVHTTSDGYSSWYEAARYFLDRMEIAYTMVPCTTAEYPTPAHRPANSILANRVLDEAGISTFTHWQTDIDEFVKKYRKQLLREVSGS